MREDAVTVIVSVTPSVPSGTVSSTMMGSCWPGAIGPVWVICGSPGSRTPFPFVSAYILVFQSWSEIALRSKSSMPPLFVTV